MTNNQAKELIRKFLKKWKYIVKSYGYDYDVYWHDNGHSMPKGYEDDPACTKSWPHYFQAAIHFNLFLFSNYSESEIEEMVVHELCHMLIAPVQRENTQDNVELSTTMISRMLIETERKHKHEKEKHKKGELLH